MDIFSDNLEWEEVDFSVYYNINGEPEPIDELSEEELSNIISTLERQLKMLPEHDNAEIWAEYLRRCREELYDE